VGDEDDDLDRFLDCDLLIIDDLGAEITNKFTVSCLYNLLNMRMIRHKSVIISTNLGKDELRERYSERVTSRLFGEFSPLLFSGRDIREQKLRRRFAK
jgi:DNA replication protein DnaC